jgi:hypothetical protein
MVWNKQAGNIKKKKRIEKCLLVHGKEKLPEGDGFSEDILEA